MKNVTQPQVDALHAASNSNGHVVGDAQVVAALLKHGFAEWDGYAPKLTDEGLMFLRSDRNEIHLVA